MSMTDGFDYIPRILITPFSLRIVRSDGILDTKRDEEKETFLLYIRKDSKDSVE